jgi:hypothetical protein
MQSSQITHMDGACPKQGVKMKNIDRAHLMHILIPLQNGGYLLHIPHCYKVTLSQENTFFNEVMGYAGFTHPTT